MTTLTLVLVKNKIIQKNIIIIQAVIPHNWQTVNYTYVIVGLSKQNI